MTRQTWTATVSAVLFVVLAAIIALVPVPFVTWSPGSTFDLLGEVQGKDGQTAAAITVSGPGVTTFETTGQLRMTTVAVTAPASALSLPEVLFSYWLPSREVLPSSAVYRPGQGPAEISDQETRLMADSQGTAVVAALRQAGIEVQTWPMVTSVSNSGASNGILKPGDLIKAVDRRTTKSVAEVQAAITQGNVGDVVEFLILRDGLQSRVKVTTRSNAAEPDRPIVGITMDIGYSYNPTVEFAIDPAIGGASAGLMFALAINDKLTEADLMAGRTIAGSGTMAADGTVGPIGGVQEKIAGAARDGAEIFVLPRSNCVDVSGAPAGIRLLPVETLAEAVEELDALTDPARAASVKGC